MKTVCTTFVNFSNHRTSDWSTEQLAAVGAIATQLDDIPFPNIAPETNSLSICEMARDIVVPLALRQKQGEKIILHVMGESTLVFNVVLAAKAAGIMCVASTTKRDSIEKVNADGTTTKTNVFKFIQFREY